MKKYIAIFLLVILIGDLSIHFLLFNLKKKEIKRTVKEFIINNVPEKELISMTMTKDDLSKLDWKDRKEFSLNNEMYDVLKSDTTNGNVKIIAYKDNKETELIATFKNFISNKLNDKLNTIKNVKFLSFDGFPQEKFNKIEIPYIIKSYRIYSNSENLADYNQEINPPPEV